MTKTSTTPCSSWDPLADRHQQRRRTVSVSLRLTPEDVQAVIDKYQDESKPDPFVAKQMRTWKLEWIPDDGDENEGGDLDDDEDGGDHEVPLEMMTLLSSDLPTGDGGAGNPTDGGEGPQRDDNTTAAAAASRPTQYVVSGRLVWKGEHATVELRSRCRWSDRPTASRLDFACRVESAQIHEGIRPGLANRLRRDAYVSPFLRAASAAPYSKLTLCEARLRPGREKYRTDPDVAEGLRRAVWGASATTAASASASDSGGVDAAAILDVFDFLLQAVPLLPVPSSAAYYSSESADATATTTPLAERAQLRLLEDAMCDACEREGEEALVEDLSLHHRQPSGGGGDDDNHRSGDGAIPSGKRAKHR